MFKYLLLVVPLIVIVLVTDVAVEATSPGKAATFGATTEIGGF
jgi:hypothetical protein